MREFDILGFVAHLGRAALLMEVEKRKAFEKAALLVENEAKSELGTYQGAVGGFVHWAELADVTKLQRVHDGFSENEPLLRTGELRDSIKHVVGDNEAAVGSDLEIAEWQELGTKKIPPRSFLGGAAARSGEEVAKILGHGFVMALVGEEVADGLIPIKK